MGIDSNWLLSVVPNLHWLRCPFLVHSKNGKSVHQLCSSYAISAHFSSEHWFQPAPLRFAVGGQSTVPSRCHRANRWTPVIVKIRASQAGCTLFSFDTRLAKLFVPVSHDLCFRVCGFGFSISQSPRWCVRAKAEWRYQTEKQWIRIGFIGYYIPFFCQYLLSKFEYKS